MIKVIFCLRRLPQLNEEEFRRHWYEIHAPLVKKHRDVLRIVRYVQVHPQHDALTEKLRAFRSSPEPFDGVAEIWYQSREALETLGRDPKARVASRQLREDEARFVDSARSPIWVGEDRLIIS